MGSLIRWNDDYCIGNETIDAEHKNLFEMANQVAQVNDSNGQAESITLLLHELYDYVQFLRICCFLFY